MALWKPFRGNRADLDAVEKHDGYIYFCVDDATLFFDYVDADGELQRKQINAKDAETLTGTSLEEIMELFDTLQENKANKFTLDGVVMDLEDVHNEIPAITKGDGKNSNVIGDGIASGDYSIAGGTTDDSMIEDIAGISLDSSLVTDEKIVESLGERGIRLRDNLENDPTPIADGEVGLVYGTGTHSITAMSVALGVGTEAGSMGFYLHKITVPDDGSNITINLSTKHSPYYKYTLLGSTIERNKSATWSDATAKQQLALWDYGDKINITLKKSYCLCESIISVDSNTGVVTVTNTGGLTKQNVEEATVFDSLVTAEGSMLALLPHHFTISVPSKPNVGAVDIGFGGIATGLGSIAAGTLSQAHGQMNLAADRGSFVVGRNNEGGLYAFASGQSTKATGKYSITAGLESEATADQSVALGHANVAKGESSVALNSRTTASGKYSTSMGRATEAYGRSQFVHGERNISDKNDKYLHIVGNSKTSGVYSNAYTLDWDGNGRFSGDVYAGVTYNSDGSVKSATKLLKAGNVSWSDDVTGKPSIKTGVVVAEDGTTTPVTGAIVEGRITGTNPNVAATEYSHAEGNQTKVVPWEASATTNAHIKWVPKKDAEGNEILDENGDVVLIVELPSDEYKNSTGANSHAEGYLTEVWGKYAHVEGSQCIAGGRYSHAEGNSTVALHRGTHSEGEHTEALGKISHAEGDNTIAKGDYQHVQGTYNIIDDTVRTSGSYKNRSQYAHIVGNGTSASKRSNAHTVDWDGNAWFAGSITMNGDKKVASEEFVTNAIGNIEIPEVEAITFAEIDAICGATIYAASEVIL